MYRRAAADNLASTNTGLAAIQLAKLAGLRIIAVADLTRHSRKLFDLGVDIQVDRHDSRRAIEIISNTTDNNLRFGLDSIGRETAAHLQEALERSRGGKQAHLVGLTGLPKERLPGIKYHNVPVKVFHSMPPVGEQIMDWLERLLLEKALKTPEIVIASGGLEGINGALDQLRNGTVSRKRIVVPITKTEQNVVDDTESTVGSWTRVKNFDFADKLNSSPSRIKFA